MASNLLLKAATHNTRGLNDEQLARNTGLSLPGSLPYRRKRRISGGGGFYCASPHNTDALSSSEYLCCAIAFDTSKTGDLLQYVAAFIGGASGLLLLFKVWAGYKEIREKETQRPLRWVQSFISKELLLTVDLPPSDQGKEQPNLVQRDLIIPLFKLIGEFVESVQSKDEEKADRVKGQLGEARSKLEREQLGPTHSSRESPLSCLVPLQRRRR